MRLSQDYGPHLILALYAQQIIDIDGCRAGSIEHVRWLSAYVGPEELATIILR